MSDLDSDRDQPKGRSTALAVVLATVFLTILGAMVGVILGTTQKNGGTGTNVANESPTPGATVTGTEATPAYPSNGTRTNTKPPSTAKTYRPTTKDDCPQQTDEKAGTDLTVQLYIKTSSSEVWICKGGGRTYYQGHVLNKPFNNDSTLFVANPYYEAGVWRADNNNHSYYVSLERLRITKNGAEFSNEPVEDSYGG
jgi:hypothetical protein